jgi:YidC/Oxa1 family membrane protein insertase
MKKQILNIILLAVAFTLLWQSFTMKDQQEDLEAVENKGVLIESNKDSYVVGRETTPIEVTITNDTQNKISLIYPCDSEILFNVYSIDDEKTDSCDLNTTKTIELDPQTPYIFDLLPYSYELFSEIGFYKIEFLWKQSGSDEIQNSNVVVQFKEPSFITKGWRVAIYKPIYNSLVAIAYYLPGQSVGFAIIILTLIIRTILLAPMNKSMKSQRAMQEIQPKIQKIQKEYKGNQAKIAEETMKIWKQHKVNPMGSCLPILIQAPIMIGVFYAVRSGFAFHHEYLLYDFMPQVDFLLLNTNFLGILELTQRNYFVLPLIVGGLQFVQIKLSMVNKKKGESKKKKENKKKGGDMADSMQAMQSSMLYVMPLMIAFFCASFPAGIGLYWGSSTAYGIVQQMFINKK